jgi:hypothetical protein
VSIALPRSFPPSDFPRDATVRVCLTADEKRRLQQLARAQGRSLSELMRVAAEPLLSAPAADPGGRGAEAIDGQLGRL